MLKKVTVALIKPDIVKNGKVDEILKKVRNKEINLKAIVEMGAESS